MTSYSAGAGLLLVILVVAMIIGFPLVAIWAVNTLFGTTIAYTFTNWFAMLFLGAYFGGSRTSKSSS